MLQHRITRRQLLQGLGGTALLSFLGRMNALAQTAPPDYKALVCVFLSGGNDSHNMIVPLSSAQFAAYKAARGSLALPDNNGALLPVETPDGTPFGLNPGLQRDSSAVGAGTARGARERRHARAAGDARASSSPARCRCRPICSRTPIRFSRCRAACRRPPAARAGARARRTWCSR